MTLIPQAVENWCQEQGRGAVTNTHSVSGGCINQTSRIQCEDGSWLFLKQNTSIPADMFPGEAQSLIAMGDSNGPRIPNIYLVGDDFLLMEYLEPGTPASDYWTRFGRELAQMHQTVSKQHGFPVNTYCGATLQDNTWEEDGHVFFGQRRLVYLARLNHEAAQLDAAAVNATEALATKLNELIPKQKASLLHGDLWSGNAHTGPDGEPALIDPASYYSWAEADLAMTTLFGNFPNKFYDAYTEINHLEQGWRDRFDIYNLYHLLNHLYLFGGSYRSGVLSTLSKYI